jgi:hypothetical protein
MKIAMQNTTQKSVMLIVAFYLSGRFPHSRGLLEFSYYYYYCYQLIIKKKTVKQKAAHTNQKHATKRNKDATFTCLLLLFLLSFRLFVEENEVDRKKEDRMRVWRAALSSSLGAGPSRGAGRSKFYEKQQREELLLLLQSTFTVLVVISKQILRTSKYIRSREEVKRKKICHAKSIVAPRGLSCQLAHKHFKG